MLKLFAASLGDALYIVHPRPIGYIMSNCRI